MQGWVLIYRKKLSPSLCGGGGGVCVGGGGGGGLGKGEGRVGERGLCASWQFYVRS